MYVPGTVLADGDTLVNKGTWPSPQGAYSSVCRISKSQKIYYIMLNGGSAMRDMRKCSDGE